MKKLSIILFLCFSLFLAQQAFAGIEIGAFGGYNLLLNNNLSVQGATKGGVAFGGKVGLNMSILTLGVMAGYFPIYHASYSATILGQTVSYDDTSYEVPILAFGQLDLGPIYVMGGLGYYSSHTKQSYTIGNTTTSQSTTTSTGDFGFALGAGYTISIPGAPISIPIGGLYQRVTGKDNNNLNMFSILAGVNLTF